jgi:hypothetical protein
MSDLANKFKIFTILPLVILLLGSSKSFAITPTPPVSIKATLEEIKGDLVGGRFSFVIDLEQHEEKVQRISVQAFLTPDKPGRFSVKRDANFRKRVDLRKAKRLEIPVEVEEPGTYELLVRLLVKSIRTMGFPTTSSVM